MRNCASTTSTVHCPSHAMGPGTRLPENLQPSISKRGADIQRAHLPSSCGDDSRSYNLILGLQVSRIGWRAWPHSRNEQPLACNRSAFAVCRR